MSGKQSKTSLSVAMGAASPIALNSAGEPPDWIMLLPAGAGGVITTVDGRGPYRVRDAVKLAADSVPAGNRIPIDENHATDLASPSGGPAPARGWATELQARADGIYGRVDWNASGKALLSDHAYRFISPALSVDAQGNVTRVLRAALTNNPNLHGMAALHSQETNMDLLAQLRKLLGLADDADEAAIIAKITSMTGEQTATASAIKPLATLLSLQSVDVKTVAGQVTTSLQSIAKAAGIKADSDVTAITAAVTALAAGKSPATDAVVIALQSEVQTLGERLNTTLATTAKEKATAYVDAEIAKGRAGVKPMRDEYITMHAADPAKAEKLIGAMPIIGGPGSLSVQPPANKDGSISLNSEQLNAANILGIKPEDYQKTLAAEQSAA